MTSDLVVILPGGAGTFSELRLAREYDKQIMVFFGADGTVDGKSAEQIKAEFTGIAVAETEDGLKGWLFEQTSFIRSEYTQQR